MAVVLVNPAAVKTKILAKGKAQSEKLDRSPQWMELYAKYLVESELEIKALAMADTTAVTDGAIVDAVVNTRPQARYFVANALGIPAVVMAFIARVLPTYLVDILLSP